MWLLPLSACSPPAETNPCTDDGGAAALSTCLSATEPDSYYADQGNRYFDTLESDYDGESGPTYADGVARWEWPPWLLLTGYGREDMELVDAIIRLIPTSVPTRDCRFFPTQPFARCRVDFRYDDHADESCPIYEEFTFDASGRIRFIEAWSDQPGLRPSTDDDPWAERDSAHRLSTKLPGLGSPSGALDLDGEAMTAAAAADPDVADFVARAQDFYAAWLETYEAAGPDVFATGCGWTGSTAR
jgi:hypothetical protein